MLVDPEYLKERKVFGHVLAAFRYGREDLDVLGEGLNRHSVDQFDNKSSLILRVDFPQGPVPRLGADLPSRGRQQEAAQSVTGTGQSD